MRYLVVASLLLLASGCGEPKAPPEGAPQEPPTVPVIETPSDPAATDDSAAPTPGDADNDSSAEPKEEK